MQRSQLNNRLGGLLKRLFGRGDASVGPRGRGAVIHVIVLDGTMSSLHEGCESNAGLAFKLLRETGSQVSLYYAPGIQFSHWRKLGDVILGRGINRQIRRAYGWLASRYRPGDRVFLLGYSRGAYAVRSLAGMIDRVGLLQASHATHRNVRTIYRHYECGPHSDAARAFVRAHCHADVPIEMIGVWDTVKSLGLKLPFLWRWSMPQHEFHSHHLGDSVRRGYHALAHDESRLAYEPVLWDSRTEWPGEALEQVWFRGCHGDVGGQLGGFVPARQLANIPLVWMLDRAEAAGLPLPDAWRSRFPQDADAPSVGQFRGAGKFLISRRARVIGADPSERIHSSVRLGRGRRLSRLRIPFTTSRPG